MEDQHLLKEIFQRYINNECTEQEIKFLLEHFKTDNNESTLRQIIVDKLNEYALDDFVAMPEMSRTFDETFNSILQKIDTIKIKDKEGESESISIRPLILKLMATTAIALLIFQGIYTYYKSVNKTEFNKVVKNKGIKINISPGSNKAILTLQDGSKIVLNDAKDGTLAQQGNANVVKLANGQLVYNKTNAEPEKVMYNTMTTPRGGQYKLTLPDGTEVWLNSASSITYPTAFVGKERNVSITGEAYFEVAKDKEKPFRVRSSNQTIEVLGTHFNVMAYADEDAIKTTLLEGSVKIVKNNNEASILKPGEQAVFDKNGSLKIGPALVDEALAWKNGYFKFNRVNIKYIMRQLARWYDVDVLCEGNIKDDEFVGTIGRGENIMQVLHILELDNVHFKIEDKKIIVLP
ncbi:FecR family protein [Mucilaginibacter sp.]|uniref:FecR family protein n=1 Tax=Mucilaginibacter sp. TaxID=1882438 RepID=UPI00262894B8|nr:FecR family protein [Mucilaginibacter sp.]MDB5030468.1 FecR protein [Mucilaginibacter sp.]